jgi:Amt family ammonium transporter
MCLTPPTSPPPRSPDGHITAWLLMGKPDLGMTINGCLAGLVAITAPCAFVTLPASILIGGIGGVLVVFAVLFFR